MSVVFVCTIKAAFHDANIETDTNILSRILASMSVSWNAAFTPQSNKVTHIENMDERIKL